MLNIPIIKKKTIEMHDINRMWGNSQYWYSSDGYACKRLNRKEESLAIYFVEMY